MNIRTAATAALALSAALVLAGCSTGTEDDSMPGMDHGSSEQAADVNDADVTFASMMIVHHEQAIEMSDIVLAKDGLDPEVMELAEAIKTAQAPEMEQLQGWLDDWGVDPDEHEMDGMDHGDGMMSEEDLAALEAAGGAEASRLFLEQMIVHHEGAVAMAQTQVDEGSNPDAVEFARTIIDAQTAEIQEMEDLLASL
ncbi:DUF305 domain-containing protein [Nesterenkonia sp. HG001]|uniref:DUF305 domain-containing protein n=1 Tax=Nesterenkonia sp. HG001 TaxID=2983207 RepID=UPI002AC4A00F|nr:DUF305 domain-containing protein [Nesterenkonia sp. HG001]MDZ5078863.1 DUF305 domain-containing protein [Nesterenkonia sp. HG001]